MEFLSKLILQTQAHLKGLTLSQRLAIGSCVALILVSLLWLVQWGSAPELAPLLDQPITPDELTLIENRLSALGVEYKLTGDVVMVPVDQRARLLAQLSEVRALPKDISIGFSKLIDESNVWVSQDEQDWRRTVALGNELAKVLREFEGVQEARVFIDRSTRRKVSGPPVTPTASVFVKLAPGMVLDKNRTYAIASLVSGSVAGLDITRVAVTDARTGRSHSVPSPDDSFASSDLEDRQKKEEYFAEKIRRLLANIPGLLVAVHAELDPESRKETRQEYTKPIPVTDRSDSTTQERGSLATGPGVVPNTSKAISPAGVVDRTEQSSTESTYETKPISIVTSTSPRHGLKSLAASVNVPRSYLAAIYKRMNNGQEPTDAELKALADEELAKIAEMVRTALAIKDESDAVTVKWFHDEALAQLGDGVSEAGAAPGGEIMAMVRAYGGQAGLVALAGLSLLMMLMMVRKVSEGPVLPGEEPPKPIYRVIGQRRQAEGEEETFMVNGPPVGKAEAHEQLLVGREVDESTLRVQQVIEQVADLIKEDPETSVSILRQWIEAEKQ